MAEQGAKAPAFWSDDFENGEPWGSRKPRQIVQEGRSGKQLLEVAHELLGRSPAAHLSLNGTHTTEQWDGAPSQTQTSPRRGAHLQPLKTGLSLELQPTAGWNLWPEPKWVNCLRKQ